MDFVQLFIDEMRAKGCGPAHESAIVADDVRRRYQLAGDRTHQKAAAYQLKAEGDFAVGWFRSHREGMTHRFTSSLRRKQSDYTDEERAEWKAKRDASMKANAERIREENARAAAKSEAVWAKAATSGESAYLTRKNASLNGARLYRGMICVPVKVGGRLTSLQFISPDGAKRFVTGSELVGGYFSIASKDDDFSTIIICEGFSTGDSIRKATGKPVVVAFNAGNLIAVGKVIRAKYPVAKIIFAADNDQYI